MQPSTWYKILCTHGTSFRWKICKVVMVWWIWRLLASMVTDAPCYRHPRLQLRTELLVIPSRCTVSTFATNFPLVSSPPPTCLAMHHGWTAIKVWMMPKNKTWQVTNPRDNIGCRQREKKHLNLEAERHSFRYPRKGDNDKEGRKTLLNDPNLITTNKANIDPAATSDSEWGNVKMKLKAMLSKWWEFFVTRLNQLSGAK